VNERPGPTVLQLTPNLEIGGAHAARVPNGPLVNELLPVLDDLWRALEAAEQHEEAKLEEGVRLVHRQRTQPVKWGAMQFLLEGIKRGEKCLSVSLAETRDTKACVKERRKCPPFSRPRLSPSSTTTTPRDSPRPTRSVSGRSWRSA